MSRRRAKGADEAGGTFRVITPSCMRIHNYFIKTPMHQKGILGVLALSTSLSAASIAEVAPRRADCVFSRVL